MKKFTITNQSNSLEPINIQNIHMQAECGGATFYLAKKIENGSIICQYGPHHTHKPAHFCHIPAVEDVCYLCVSKHVSKHIERNTDINTARLSC